MDKNIDYFCKMGSLFSVARVYPIDLSRCILKRTKVKKDALMNKISSLEMFKDELNIIWIYRPIKTGSQLAPLIQFIFSIVEIRFENKTALTLFYRSLRRTNSSADAACFRWSNDICELDRNPNNDSAKFIILSSFFGGQQQCLAQVTIQTNAAF